MCVLGKSIMPKKFKGENSKAAVAKERKSSAREAVEHEKKRKEEEEYWRDDNKHVQKKQERKVWHPLALKYRACSSLFPLHTFYVFMHRMIKNARSRSNWIGKNLPSYC